MSSGYPTTYRMYASAMRKPVSCVIACCSVDYSRRVIEDVDSRLFLVGGRFFSKVSYTAPFDYKNIRFLEVIYRVISRNANLKKVSAILPLFFVSLPIRG